MAERPFAVFDIDGTIIRWQLYHALADVLAKDGEFDPKQYRQVKKARMEWKTRASAASFKEYEEMLVGIFTMALTNIGVDKLNQACQTVIDEYKDQVYTYTRDLITELKAKNYLIFAISASPEQIVKMLADYYEFDDAAGSKYEIKAGRFTGHRDVLLGARKPEFLQEMINRHDASRQGSIAVGDSESDIALLSAVERPIAFNPTKELFKHAKQQGWQIVIERKNVVYQLAAKDGGYHLEK
jgi:HAD superfamily hydrolase (TIGR01490 family)